MIARVAGILDSLEGDTALVRLGGVDGGLTYAIMVPAYVAARLGGQLDQPVTFHTLYFVEAPAQGGTMHPRLAGFLSVEDRRFFELFTTCKGIGYRKAMRAMSLDTAQIAAAIADRDIALLKSLPEIGKRTAETIVASLHGKVDRFITSAAYAGQAADGATPAASTPADAMSCEVLEVLLQLGENRAEAMHWIQEALRDEDDRPRDPQELLARVYQIRGG